ncbi:hypothetical protein [Actinomyces culturomici]|uniref:hypothetical protein n=1 Tax=Actinomyces culturomici TaxID=1926276 RepID=UPI000E2060D7|nr:hypothetical protein [Actinomyces culturomici]
MSDTPLLADEEIVASATARKALAALRIVLGFVFLWAFLDRTLGLGIATRLAAACGVALMALLWLATFPPVTVDAASAAPNPLVDAHVVYALALVVVAATRAGDAWGLGRRWRRLGIVRANPWLL